MILLILVGVCLLTVPLTGGRLARLANLGLRYPSLGLSAVGLQVLVTTIAPDGHHTLHAALHIASYVLVGAFIWANRDVAGIPVISAGALANAIAIVANQGVMPASRTAERLAGLTPTGGFQNSSPLAHPHLPWLGDIIPVPGPWPLHNVLSVGDCLIYTGLILLLHRTCRTAPAPATPHEVSSPHAHQRDSTLTPPATTG